MADFTEIKAYKISGIIDFNHTIIHLTKNEEL